jgi:hypothetical protein
MSATKRKANTFMNTIPENEILDNNGNYSFLSKETFDKIYNEQLEKINISYRWELEIDNLRFNQIIEVLENSNSLNFSKSKRRFIRANYSIKIIENQKLILYTNFALKSNSNEPCLLLKKDQIYYKLGEYHSRSIHGGQKELWERVKLSFGNIKQWMSNQFVNACTICQQRSNVKHSKIAGKVIISNNFLSRIQVSNNIYN